jgi:hypothetical protein
MVNMTHLAVPAKFHTSQLDLYVIYTVSMSAGFHTITFIVTGEDHKADFPFLAIHPH